MLQRTLFGAARVAPLTCAELRLQTAAIRRIRFAPVRTSEAARSFSASSRCLAEADAAKAEGKDAAPESKTAAGDASVAELDKTKQELQKSKTEAADFKDKWTRTIADFRNLQAQTKREVSAAREFAIQKFAKDLLDSVDNLDRALSTVPEEKLTDENKDLKALHDGLRMTETILMSTLKKHGLERFDPSEQGDKFDPNRHEATFQVPQPDKEDGTVFHCQSKGFSLNGRVLRAAKVGVVKNS